jgi:hypothetical protein
MSDRCTIDVALVLALAPAHLPMPGQTAKARTFGKDGRCTPHVSQTRSRQIEFFPTQSSSCRRVTIPPPEVGIGRMARGVAPMTGNKQTASLTAGMKRFARTCCRRIMPGGRHKASAA